MATFVWVGNSGTTTDSYGNTGSTGGVGWISTDNYWGNSGNWRERVPGGQTGNTGGGATGMPGVWYYQAATRIPSGGDKVILQHLENNASEGISNGPWPKSELLYGGVSGATVSGSSGSWHGSSGGVSGDVDIEIKESYWNTPISRPYSRLRFGTNLSDNPVGYFKGLNLYIDEINSHSPNSDSNYANTQTKFNISGDDTTIDTLYVNGIGEYSVKTASINNLILEGTAVSSDNWIGKSLNYAHIGDISELCKITNTHLDNFNYIPTYNSATACNQIIVAPKYLPDTSDVVDIRGAATTLDVYPIGETSSSFTGGSKISINSYANQLTFTTIKLHEYNAWHSVVFDDSKNNCRLSFNNASGTDTISNLNIDAGVFETDDLHSTLNILDGNIQVDGTLDVRYMKPTGSVEVAGMSGGVAGDGLFNASVNSTVLLPAGVNVGFKTPSGGSTTAMNLGLGLAARGGRR